MRFEILAIHAGQPVDPACEAMILPISQTSTLAFVTGMTSPRTWSNPWQAFTWQPSRLFLSRRHE